MKKTQIWVSPNFKKYLKKMATDEGLSIIDYTHRISDNSCAELCSDAFKPKKIKKVNFFNGYE